MVDVEIRQATEDDIPPILAIINGYAAENLMLPRTDEQIRQALPHFLVAETGRRVVACGSLVELTPTLTELRSLAVAREMRGAGLGRRLVEALVIRAREAGYRQLCALTLQETFFNSLGFRTVDRWRISPKIWLECIYCPKFDACDEITVLMSLVEGEDQAEAEPEINLNLWKNLRFARLGDR